MRALMLGDSQNKQDVKVTSKTGTLFLLAVAELLDPSKSWSNGSMRQLPALCCIPIRVLMWELSVPQNF
jgi:hypothetical protein